MLCLQGAKLQRLKGESGASATALAGAHPTPPSILVGVAGHLIQDQLEDPRWSGVLISPWWGGRSIHATAHPSIHPFVHLSMNPSFSLFFFLSICFSFSPLVRFWSSRLELLRARPESGTWTSLKSANIPTFLMPQRRFSCYHSCRWRDQVTSSVSWFSPRLFSLPSALQTTETRKPEVPEQLQVGLGAPADPAWLSLEDRTAWPRP